MKKCGIMTGNTIEKMNKWKKTAEHSVGGFLWLGFSRQQTNKLICISSEYTSVMDCDTGEIKECDAEITVMKRKQYR